MNPIVLTCHSPQSLFTSRDLGILWKEADRAKLKSKIAYYVKKKDLLTLTRGVYAKNTSYDPKELATNISSPSYISFETVLQEEGVIFQHYETIFVASRFNREVTIDGHHFQFRKLKDTILFNLTGIQNENNSSIASKERALLDMLYLTPKFHFDHLNAINWNRCFELVEVYENQAMKKRLYSLYKNHAE